MARKHVGSMCCQKGARMIIVCRFFGQVRFMIDPGQLESKKRFKDPPILQQNHHAPNSRNLKNQLGRRSTSSNPYLASPLELKLLAFWPR